MDFNHAATGWCQPSPVGAFPLSYSVAGLCDGAGNVWEWCINALPGGAQPYTVAGSRQQAQADWDPNDGTSARALRGGAFGLTADYCRPAFRGRGSPDVGDGGFGVRFVRCWLPHSEH